MQEITGELVLPKPPSALPSSPYPSVSAENQRHYTQLLGKAARCRKTKRPLFGWKNHVCVIDLTRPFISAAGRAGIRECAGVVQLFHICYK